MPWKNDIVISILNVMDVNRNLIWRKNSLNSIWNHFVRNALISSHQNSKNELRKTIQRNSKKFSNHKLLPEIRSTLFIEIFQHSSLLRFWITNQKRSSSILEIFQLTYSIQPIRVQSTVNKACFPNTFIVFNNFMDLRWIWMILHNWDMNWVVFIGH